MNELQQQLISITKTIATLLEGVEKIIAEIAKLQPIEKAASTKKAAPTKKAASAEAMTVLETVYEVIRKSRNGATIAKLKEKTSLSSRQLSNAVYKLKGKGKVVSKSRGVYSKKK